MSVPRLRLVSAAVAVGLAVAFAAALPAAAAATPPPLNEGPAGPPALLPNGRVATPPRVTAPQISTSCPAAPYGSNSAAPGTGKTVALTFDDGPGASTASILSILESYGVPATFFNLGQNAAARPQLARDEAAAGYLLGNHTWDHPNMTKLPASAQGTEMDRASAEQRTLTGTQPCAFRPPGGNYNSTTLSLAQQRRMKFWTWSVDTEDWKANGSSSSYWVNRIISLAEQEGRVLQHPVVLMHNQPAGNPATVLALPTIIKYFRGLGYTFVDLLGRTRWSSRQAAPAAAQANGAIDVWYKAFGTNLNHRWSVPGVGWQGPAWMGAQPVAGEPSVVTSVPGRVDVFWKGGNGGLWHQYSTGGAWSAQQDMRVGTIGGYPRAVAQPDGAMDVFWRGSVRNYLWHASYVPGSGWQRLQNLGGSMASDPAPVTSAPGAAEVFWKGTDGHLWHVFKRAGAGWSAPGSLGMGALGSGPQATGALNGAVDVFWRGSVRNYLWHADSVPGRGWQGPQNLGGSLASDPAPVTSAPGAVEVYWKGTDGHLWHAYKSAARGWSGAASLGMGVLGSRPWATGRPDGSLDVFWRGSADDNLWHAYNVPGHGWHGPQNLGGHLYPVVW
jgi:peptidoglycan/xylan/chitin deacetylase (PgdA/CDA1 family)